MNVNTLTRPKCTVRAMRKSLQERARFARLRAGFRLPQDAADAIGCSRPLVLAWENGSAKSIGGKYLLPVAKAYKVRPEWLTLNADDDGFPFTAAEPISKPAAQGIPLSQIGRPDPHILHEAVTLLLFDLDHGGPRSARSASSLLQELYDRIAAAGGQLPAEEEQAFEEQARARGQKEIVNHERVEQRRNRTRKRQ